MWLNKDNCIYLIKYIINQSCEVLFKFSYSILSPLINANYNNGHKCILVLEPNALGDSITILCMYNELKQLYPGYKIIAVINTNWKDLHNKISNYDEVIFIDLPWSKKSWKNRFYSMSPANFQKIKRNFSNYSIEYAYEVRGDVFNQIFLKWLGAKKIISWDCDLTGKFNNLGLLLYKRYKMSFSLNREQLNKSLIGNLSNLENSSKIKIVNNIFIHIAAGWVKRLWDKGKWLALITKLQYAYPLLNITIISDKPNDTYNFLKANLDSKVSFVITSLNNLYDMLSSQCDLFLGLDSGITHIAAHLRKPVIVLFGPGQLPLWQPNIDKKKIIHHQEYFPCAPCGQKSCYEPKNCMDMISVDEVYAAFKDLLKEVGMSGLDDNNNKNEIKP
jgi:ADP-heptose:LPS heptosyltransferase